MGEISGEGLHHILAVGLRNEASSAIISAAALWLLAAPAFSSSVTVCCTCSLIGFWYFSQAMLRLSFTNCFAQNQPVQLFLI